jgi:hypothetical protein
MRRWAAASIPFLLAAPAAAAHSEAPGSKEQHALVATVDGSVVLAHACREAAGCDPAAGARFDIPAEADPARAAIEELRLSPRRRALLVTVPAGDGGGRWVLLLHASAAGEPPAVREQLRGFVDRPRAARSGDAVESVLLREQGPGGTDAIVVGKRYDGVDVCGRPAILGVRRFDAATLDWVAAPTRSLSPEQLVGATALTAAPRSSPNAAAPVLVGTVASSAVAGTKGALTDGDLATRWAEARDGAGSGEFVVMSAPGDLAITGFDIVLRPTGDQPADAAAPRTIHVATRSDVFTVALPADALAQPPGTVYGIDLPHEVRSDCVALVLGDTAQSGEVAVGVAELGARTRFDAASPAELARALDDEARADAARALLLRGGVTWQRAVIDAWPTLGDAGKRRALEILDAADCEVTAPFYAARLLGKGADADFHPDLDETAGHARDRLRRCRGQAKEALVAALKAEPSGESRVWAARELALLAPADAVEPILGLLDEGDQARSGNAIRRGLRAALASAARHTRAKNAVAALLVPARFAELSLVQRIDFLRAIGGELPAIAGAGDALAAVLAADASLSTRYLLQEPAAHLCVGKDERAVSFLRKSLRSDESAHVRAQAARVAGGVPALAADLVAALGDSAPRVREAALEALAAAPSTSLDEPVLVGLLADDPWTFVRVGAARALGAQPSSPGGDAALVATLEDSPLLVQRAALEAIGRRRAVEAGGAVHEKAARAKEPLELRIAAVAALGQLCRDDSAELLYKLALRAGAPQLPYDEKLGIAALHALGEIKPADIAERLAPLVRTRRVPRTVRALAADAIERKSACKAAGGGGA